ncbi:MAG: GntR family transcriptional regulator [Alphaproteobacteria bacterium]
MVDNQILNIIHQAYLQPTTENRPIYLRISQLIEETINNYQIGENEALPSERDLANMLGVSRITIRKSIDNLAQKGVVVRIHGSGTFVKKQIQQNLTSLSGFTEEFGTEQTKLHQKWLRQDTAKATEQEALGLNIPKGSLVSHLKRIRYINHMPLSIEHAVIPQLILDDPTKIKHSLYQYLRESHHAPVRAIQKISAQICPNADAPLLEIAPQSAILYIERRTFDPSDTIVEYVRSLYRSDLYELVAELHIVGEK